MDAFRQSVAETMSELEAEMQVRVRKGRDWNGDTNRTTGNLVYGEFVHLTSRPVDGIPDPHLHAHCFVFNASYDHEEQRWKAGQFGGLKRDASYYEAAFDARMAHRLEGLGYRVERTSEKGWEIAGVPDSAIRKFSRRNVEIEALAKELGITDPEAKHRIAEKSRKNKDRGLGMDQLREVWFERMLSDQEARALDQVVAGGHGEDPSGPGRPSARDTLDYATGHVFERESVVPEKRLKEAALRYGVGSVTVDQVSEEAKREEILRRELDGQVQCSTREVLGEEEALLRFAREGRNALRPFTDKRIKFGPMVEDGKTFELSDDQKRAIEHVLHSPDRVTAIRGGAGTGKTTMMKRTIGGIDQTTGQRVQTLAPTSAAVDVLQNKEGFKDAHTVARFLIDEDLQKQARGQVLWVDEAGLLGTRDLHRVFQVAQEQGARVILSGDVRQHTGVARGDSLRLLEQHAGVRTAELTRINRQQVDSYREAVARIAKGDVQGGFDRLDGLGLIREEGDESTRYRQLAADYVETTSRKQSVLVVAPTHAEGEKATAAIRQARKEEGQLGEERSFVSLKNRQLTEVQRRDPLAYREGDVVQVMQNLKGFSRGDRLTVVGRDENGQVRVQRHQAPPPGDFRGPGVPGETILPLDRAQHLQVYEASTLTIAVGDKIRVTQNSQTRDKKRVANGTVLEVAGFTKGEVGDPFSNDNIILSNGKVLNKDVGHLTHGYVTTSHSAQGRTVDAVLIAQSSESGRAGGRQQWYVSASRGRREIRVYTDDKQELREAIGRGGERTAATELLRQGRPVVEKPDMTDASDAAGKSGRARSLERVHYWQRAATLARTYASRTADRVRETYGRWSEQIRREREQPEMTR